MSTEIAQRLEGLHTLDTASAQLGMTRGSTLNVLSKLKKEGYVTVQGGRQQVRFYKVTTRKQLPRVPGMFDLLNKYNPNFKLNEWYDHQVHGTYTVEDAIVDAVTTKSFRALLATLRLFNHVTEWSRLYRLAKEKGVWQQVGALYDVARQTFRVRRMPRTYGPPKDAQVIPLGRLKDRNNYPAIQEKWNVLIPFNKHDVREL